MPVLTADGRLLAGVGIAIDDGLGGAGMLLARSGNCDAVDATVVCLAADGDDVGTSDPGDLRAWPKRPGSTSTSSLSHQAASTCIRGRRPEPAVSCPESRRWWTSRHGKVAEFRTLAALMSSLGAKLGANVHRHQATPGHVQPREPQVNATPGDVQPRRATAGVCMACKRSGVRIPIAPPKVKRIIRISFHEFPGCWVALWVAVR